MANNQFTHIAGDISSTNVQLSNAYTAFATEQTIKKKWENIWLRAFPLLTVIREGGTNWNKNAEIKGNLAITPIMLADMSTPADGVTDANELTGITPFASTGATQAAYRIAHYRGAMYIRASEDRLINNTRGNFLEFKTIQLMDSFTNAIADDAASTAADSRTAVLGVQQALATANTVGGLDQSSDTDWASNVTTSAGAFALDLLDDKMDAVKNRRGKIDLIDLAYSSTVNLFGKLRAQIQPSWLQTDDAFNAKYGFENVIYRNAKCVSDGRLTSGVICGFDTTTWGWLGDERPALAKNGVQRYPGTDAEEHMYNMFCALWCNNPAKNFRLTGVT